MRYRAERRESIALADRVVLFLQKLQKQIGSVRYQLFEMCVDRCNCEDGVLAYVCMAMREALSSWR